jgi:hypothetical protein
MLIDGCGGVGVSIVQLDDSLGRGWRLTCDRGSG